MRDVSLHRSGYNPDMVNFSSQAAEYFVYTIIIVGSLFLVWAGYMVGRMLAMSQSQKRIKQNESDLFTAQTGFKKLYEGEIATLKSQNEALKAQAAQLEHRVEEYRKKAAGFGGLFSSSSKKSDAMYALLLENEALEEALHKQNQKLNTERTDAVQESLRNISYRRVLMSQLLNDNRIKDYVRDILEDEGRLPTVEQPKITHE
jgi:predicted lactoylglutathione lyase